MLKIIESTESMIKPKKTKVKVDNNNMISNSKITN